jgi:DNA-binding XRE family transcriptional regulator
MKHNLAVMRKALGLTQRRLASCVNVSVSTIQAIELGKLKMSRGLARRIEHRFGVDAEWLRNNLQIGMPELRPGNQPYNPELEEWL